MNASTMVREHRSQLSQLRALADRDLFALLREIEGAGVVETRNILIQVLPELVAPYTTASGELAAVLFEDLRSEAGRRGVFYAQATGTAPATERVASTAAWAVEALRVEALESTLQSRLSGAVAKLVFDASRETMLANSGRESVGFQRMPRPGCCAFCGMLASRGAAYSSRASAAAGHDDCRCVVMPVYPGTPMAELASVESDKYETMYRQSLTDEDGNSLSSTKDILAEWRKYHGTK